MEEDSELLDWGNEDDEQNQDALKRNNDRRGLDNVEDVEDSVSLGDEDETEHEPYAYRNEETNGRTSTNSTGKDANTPPTSKSSKMSHNSRTERAQDDSHSEIPPATESSQRPQNATDRQTSPQRSLSFSSGTRLTHALPPKPVAANVPYLPPSHPSIVEATAMSNPVGSRDVKKTNGGSLSGAKPSSSAAELDKALPPDWEIRHPRSGRGTYYYNIVTHQSTWTRPVSNNSSSYRDSHSTNTRRSRGSGTSTGGRIPSPSKSDEIPPQSSRSRPLPNEAENSSSNKSSQQHSMPISAPVLSFDDRHYRPQGDVAVSSSTLDSLDGRHPRNIDNSARRYTREDQYANNAMTPPASPGHPRERARSLSPSPSEIMTDRQRGRYKDSHPPRVSQRPAWGRQPVTNVDLSIQRDRDFHPGDSEFLDRSWTVIPSDHGLNAQQDFARHQEPNTVVDMSVEAFNDRHGLSRNSHRGREPRVVENREQPDRNSSLPVSRNRSPPHSTGRDKSHEARHGPQQSDPTSPDVPLLPPRRDRPSRFDRQVPHASLTSGDQMRTRDYDQGDIGVIHYSERRTGERGGHDEPTRIRASQSTYSKRDDVRDYDYKHSDNGRISPGSDQNSSRWKRAPLPSQTTRFREHSTPDIETKENSKGFYSQVSHSSTPNMQSRPLTEVEPKRVVNSYHPTNNLPSGPRQQKVDSSLSRYDSEKNAWESRRNRRGPVDHPQSPLVDAMEVDNIVDYPDGSKYSPPPSFGNPEVVARAGSEMYADQGTVSQIDTPRGPRAMFRDPPSNSTEPHASIPSTYDDHDRSRDRFGGPHPSNGRPDYDYREDSGRDRHVSDYHPGEKAHWDTKSRPAEISWPPLPTNISDTNSVPIGTRRSKEDFANVQQHHENTNSSKYPDLPPGKETYERPAHLNIIEPRRTGQYRDPEPPRNRMHRNQQRRQVSPLTHEPERVNHSNRRQSRFSPEDHKPRFDPPVEQEPLPPRTWIPRQVSPGPQRGSNSRAPVDDDFVTPPPLSREASAASSAWDAPDRGRFHREDHRIEKQTRAPMKVGSSYGPPPLHQIAGLPERPEPYTGDIAPPFSAKVEIVSVEHLPSRYSGAPSQMQSLREEVTVDPESSRPPEYAIQSKPNVETHTPHGRTRTRWGEPIRPPPVIVEPVSSENSHPYDSKHVTNQVDESSSGRRDARRLSADQREDNLVEALSYAKEKEDNKSELLTADLSERLERPGPRRGRSLLDRLSINEGEETPPDTPPPSLRDRVQIPSKREREGDIRGAGDYQDLDAEDVQDKRTRRRFGKSRRSGRRGGSGA